LSVDIQPFKLIESRCGLLEIDKVGIIRSKFAFDDITEIPLAIYCKVDVQLVIILNVDEI
jgi:hypothetical protein